MIDKFFCLSSFFVYRCIFKDDMDFFTGMKHCYSLAPKPVPTVKIESYEDIDKALDKKLADLQEQYNSVGILLSGGMDSAILASYLRPGSRAYTFCSNITGIYDKEILRAKYYCDKFSLLFNTVDISFDDYKNYSPIVMRRKCAPVHSIEPQIYKAALQAKNDGVDLLLVGASADDIFGGVDKLLSRDWKYDEFIKRYTFLDPVLVLSKPVDVYEAFEKYKIGDNDIDFIGFLDDISSSETRNSFYNALSCAGLNFNDPYENMFLVNNLDLNRIRNGESKYYIRELFKIKYPELYIPEKLPMPRLVDFCFNNWHGPLRAEFRKDIPMDMLSGDQKWLLWSAELFINYFAYVK